MIVICEACNTKFRLDPGRLRGPKSKVRCSRCGSVFVLAPEEEDLIHIDLADEMDLSAGDSTIPTPSLAAPAPPRPRKGVPRKKLLMAVVAVLILGTGLLGVISYLGSLPKEKAAEGLGETPTIKVLDTTQAFFLENTHAGQIFVVEGEVENQSAKPASFILMEGKLYNTTNRVAITQRCYAGNAMSRDELSRMNITEIQSRMMNREGKSLSNVKSPPGKHAPFMLVFHNLPELKALSDYSVEVVSSKLD